LRRKAECRDFFHPVSAHLLDHVRDIRTPIPHGDVNRNLLACCCQLGLDQPPLLQRDLCQWAVANKRVAALYLFDEVLRQRTAADHVAQVRRNLLDGLGRAMRQ